MGAQQAQEGAEERGVDQAGGGQRGPHAPRGLDGGGDGEACGDFCAVAGAQAQRAQFQTSSRASAVPPAGGAG